MTAAPRRVRCSVPEALARRCACAPACLALALGLAGIDAPGALAAATGVGIQPLLQPYTLGARAKASVSLHFYGGDEHVPAPLSGAVLHFPAGLHIDLSGAAVCSAAQLRRHGGAGCPSSSLVGHGSATLIVRVGSQTLPEHVTVSVFRGPDRDGRATFQILAQGQTPLRQTTLTSATVLGDSPPYGSKLIIAVPPIPTLRYEPNASFSALSLTIGGTPGARDPIVIPSRCPAGGFPFAASFSFADHSSTGEAGRLPCP